MEKNVRISALKMKKDKIKSSLKINKRKGAKK